LVSTRRPDYDPRRPPATPGSPPLTTELLLSRPTARRLRARSLSPSASPVPSWRRSSSWTRRPTASAASGPTGDGRARRRPVGQERRKGDWTACRCR
jgi:hypothetical protein